VFRPNGDGRSQVTDVASVPYGHLGRSSRLCATGRPNVAVELQAAFQARSHRSGALLAANELLAASGELQAA
jgi:hypothetical protein